MASNILITNNVMLSLAKILTHMDKPISAQCCLVVGGIRTSKRKIDYDILPDGSEKDNAEATSDGKRGSNGKTSAISHVTITLGPMQKRIDTKNGDICYSNPYAILCSSANY